MYFSCLLFFFAPTYTHSRTRTRTRSGRIGRIIKLDQDVQSVTKEATALIGKAMVRRTLAAMRYIFILRPPSINQRPHPFVILIHQLSSSSITRYPSTYTVMWKIALNKSKGCRTLLNMEGVFGAGHILDSATIGDVELALRREQGHDELIEKRSIWQRADGCLVTDWRKSPITQRPLFTIHRP